MKEKQADVSIEQLAEKSWRKGMGVKENFSVNPFYSMGFKAGYAAANQPQPHESIEDEKEVNELGEVGLKRFRKTVKFGDIILNGYASEMNPHRKGIAVKLSKDLLCTDGNGEFWNLVVDNKSKIKIIGRTFKAAAAKDGQAERGNDY